MEVVCAKISPWVSGSVVERLPDKKEVLGPSPSTRTKFNLGGFVAVIRKKVWREYFEKIISGKKKF